MKQTEWKMCDGAFKESLFVLDNGSVLFKLRVFRNREGIVRNGTGCLLYTIRAVPGESAIVVTPTEQLLEHWVRELLCGDIHVVRKALEVVTPSTCGLFPKKFMQEVHEFINYGKCDICPTVTARHLHQRDGGTVNICSTCKIKYMLVGEVPPDVF